MRFGASLERFGCPILGLRLFLSRRRRGSPCLVHAGEE